MSLPWLWMFLLSNCSVFSDILFWHLRFLLRLLLIYFLPLPFPLNFYDFFPPPSFLLPFVLCLIFLLSPCTLSFHLLGHLCSFSVFLSLFSLFTFFAVYYFRASCFWLVAFSSAYFTLHWGPHLKEKIIIINLKARVRRTHNIHNGSPVEGCFFGVASALSLKSTQSIMEGLYIPSGCKHVDRICGCGEQSKCFTSFYQPPVTAGTLSLFVLPLIALNITDKISPLDL